MDAGTLARKAQLEVLARIGSVSEVDRDDLHTLILSGLVLAELDARTEAERSAGAMKRFRLGDDERSGLCELLSAIGRHEDARNEVQAIEDADWIGWTMVRSLRYQWHENTWRERMHEVERIIAGWAAEQDTQYLARDAMDLYVNALSVLRGTEPKRWKKLVQSTPKLLNGSALERMKSRRAKLVKPGDAPGLDPQARISGGSGDLAHTAMRALTYERAWKAYSLGVEHGA